MKEAKLDLLILTAMGLTFKRHPDHANKLLNRARTVGTRLIGRWAAADAFTFRKLFTREGLREIEMPDPLRGCRYFEIPLMPGEGVVGAIPLKEALKRGIAIWAEKHPDYGWRFISNHIGELSPATCLRMVIGPPSLKEEDKPKEYIFWHWFPHNPEILERPPIDRDRPMKDFGDLIKCAREHFDDAIVRLGPVSGAAEKVWDSVFNGQMSGVPMVSATDETQACPILPEEQVDQSNGSDTTVVLEFSPDNDTGRVVRLMNITADDTKDPPETPPVSEEERSLRLE